MRKLHFCYYISPLIAHLLGARAAPLGRSGGGNLSMRPWRARLRRSSVPPLRRQPAPQLGAPLLGTLEQNSLSSTGSRHVVCVASRTLKPDASGATRASRPRMGRLSRASGASREPLGGNASAHNLIQIHVLGAHGFAALDACNLFWMTTSLPRNGEHPRS